MNKDVLELLHEKLADKLLERLESGEITASEMSVVRQFLNDNNVSLVDDKMSNIKNTVDNLPSFSDLKQH